MDCRLTSNAAGIGTGNGLTKAGIDAGSRRSRVRRFPTKSWISTSTPSALSKSRLMIDT